MVPHIRRISLANIKRQSSLARTGSGGMEPHGQSNSKNGRLNIRGVGNTPWSTSDTLKLLAGSAIFAVGVIAIIPRFGRGGGGGGFGRAPMSSVFADVRVPAETVPVSLGRVIGTHGAGSTLDAQVCTRTATG